MAAIKFSKQYIEPNPNEIDYWVDLSSNQYGGRMKYHNGFEWVDLVNPDGTHIDINDFYNKLQINQMLSQKASVDSVESKVDDDEVSDVIKNISFSQRGEDGVEMVMFKYDDTTVGIQLPIADNTKSGIITKDTFKNLVNQTQLQQLYSEMYTKLSEIRNNYQPKLRAGANIKIENNVISAVSKIGTDWNDIANKPDIYDKSQVDVMMSGVYKIKGSRRFEALPLYTNTIGDTYNITNDFSLHGEDYPMGTNVVWTENGWDALAGIFDTSDLEEDIQEVKDNYLPLTGGILDITSSQFSIKRKATQNYITFIGQDMPNGTVQHQGYLGFLGINNPIFIPAEANYIYKIWHEGNDGPDSGLDADTLDGLHSNSFAKYIANEKLNANTISSGLYGGKLYDASNVPFGYYAFLSAGTNNYKMQFNSGKNILYFRSGDENGLEIYPWKTIAFTDSDITGNAATASKLATPIKLWGASIDGTQDYGGSLTLMSNTAINGTTEDGKVEHCLIPRWSDGKTYFNFGSTGLVVRNNDSDVKMVILPDGNVGIGTTYPQYKLDVDGNIGVPFEKGVFFKNKENQQQWSIKSAFTNNENSLFVRNELSTFNILTVLESGKIGIGINTPNAKLHISEGNLLILQKNSAVLCKLQQGDRAISLQIDTYKGLYDHNSKKWLLYSNNDGDETHIWGKKLIIHSGENNTNRIITNSSGNVTIGSSDLAGETYKLSVNGNSEFINKLFICNRKDTQLTINPNGENTVYIQSGVTGNLSGTLQLTGLNSSNLQKLKIKANSVEISDQITSGDLVDWYGVSWSEDSSDPTCTRIGNMALHRSLPILSAMKGYFIYNTDTKGITIPLKEDWSGVKYHNINNHAGVTMNFISGNTMIKIPEFWYIDEYEPSTKTHNLKISQTAKAGWCHHKEAYVGAYEGYNDGDYYKSVKGRIPTVSVSRETLRPLARANGFEDEYKWNIYTYEEHRAICHLFLVEYATRNSQLAVNTELTADGFRQGGLGSGCTTGTMDDAYSFIPTGTTDSLGNGSGQVAYTASNGVTYYANRYRGIENPFGHIWKHVDDVINIYNSSSTYKTVYKCDKPEYFATNKNAKYKPLCSFPGGSKMVGWSKEIKATVNCDFFKYSVGGSESTYWCDYNYDNDDTSEHCLLIGGNSGNDGAAGLFYFTLRNGVGGSSVFIGSRLTYLPWAE